MGRPDRAPPPRRAPRESRPPWRRRRARGTSSSHHSSSGARDERLLLAAAPQPALRVDRLLAIAQLEIEIGPFQRAGLADGAHRLAAADRVPERLLQLVEVRHQREHAVAVIDDQEVAKSLEPPRVRYLPAPDGAHRRSRGRAHVDPVLQRDRAEPGIDCAAEPDLDAAPLDRKRQPATGAADGRLEQDLGRRFPRGPVDLGDPARELLLRLLQIPDGFLVHHAIALHGREQRPLLFEVLLEDSAPLGLAADALILLGVRRGQLPARPLRLLRLSPQDSQRVEVRAQERVEEAAPRQEVRHAARAQQEPDVPFPAEPVSRDQPRSEHARRRVELRLHFFRALLDDRQRLRRRAQPHLRRPQRPALDLNLPLELRQPAEHGGLAARELLRRRPLLREPVLQVRQRLRERGDGEQRDHVRRNRATAIQLPAKPTRAPATSSAPAWSGNRCGARTPAAKANACEARGRSQLWAERMVTTASAAPSTPCSAPSSRKGARTYPSVAPTSFMISI